MTERMASGVGPARLDIAYEEFGEPGDPPVLLIMGGAAQMIHWPEEFCAELAGRGLRVIRFDSRDTGRSTWMSDAPEPDVVAAMAGDASSAAYNLSDMAADTVGLLDALEIGGAHLVGLSMGGMIAQTVAIEYPDRVRSLTSMSATTGNPAVGQPKPGVLGSAGRWPRDRDGYIAWQVRNIRAVGSPGFAFDEAAVADRAGRAYDRGVDESAMMRHFLAVLASETDRTDQLATLRVPTLVIHGLDDPMIDVSGGRATAAAIPGARLVTYPGLGHSLPPELFSAFADEIAALVAEAEQNRA
ncbi:alpha/beta hydrolase [Nocardia sp. CDC153]|uniref:alpha/beta fold hydrolase n=1 Tax=Nocardia sp. CDC153 TaxID=3112167 RepID=UPI002DBB160F|nr:alpha/beta hydrolase [Nocardia sp. CDC153]MEC3954258.1 alpha/beta hydrolase [Nocardia sp. CDC153]